MYPKGWTVLRAILQKTVQLYGRVSVEIDEISAKKQVVNKQIF
jgi:hypothetical protein